MRRIYSAAVPAFALAFMLGLGARYSPSAAGTRTVNDLEASDVYGGAVVPVCGKANPIACDGTDSVCTYTPCINIIGSGDRKLGVVLNCSTDDSDKCGHVNRSAACLDTPEPTDPTPPPPSN